VQRQARLNNLSVNMTIKKICYDSIKYAVPANFFLRAPFFYVEYHFPVDNYFNVSLLVVSRIKYKKKNNDDLL